VIVEISGDLVQGRGKRMYFLRRLVKS